MALQQFLFGLAAAIILTFKGSDASAVCGTVNGSNASPWPWQATIVSNTSYGTYFYCEGSLISDRWILSSAKCLNSEWPESLVVYLGSTTSDGYLNSTVIRSVEAKHCHSSYDMYLNDICLLKLSAPVSFSPSVSPVCLAQRGSTFYTGVGSWVGGWGNGEVPAYYDMAASFVGPNECGCRRSIVIPYGSICAESGNNTDLQGSGQPLLVRTDSAWVQSGLLSQGCDDSEPCLYTDVSKYQDWIAAVAGGGQQASAPGFVLFTSPGEDSDADYHCTTFMYDIFSHSGRTNAPFCSLLLLCGLVLMLNLKN